MMTGSVGTAALIASQILIPDSATALAAPARDAGGRNRLDRLPAAPHTAGSTLLASVSATAGPLHGATLILRKFPHGTTLPRAISKWDGFTGTHIQASKAYYRPGEFPRQPGRFIRAMADAGIKAMLCFKPSFKPLRESDRKELERVLRMFKKLKLEADVTLWQEPQDFHNHLSAEHYIAMVHYYGPTVRKYYPLAYDAAGHGGGSGWTAYYPGDASVDKIAVDYYAHHFVSGERLDVIAGLADKASPAKPFGIWEMGNTTSNGANPTRKQVEAYFSYVQSFMAGRLAAGKPNAETAWFNGSVNAIISSSDYRAALWRDLVNATGGYATALDGPHLRQLATTAGLIGP